MRRDDYVSRKISSALEVQILLNLGLGSFLRISDKENVKKYYKIHLLLNYK